uniref:Putative capsid protein n=1 Tax=Magnaporthe oryzae partitivirus 3 TaxID=2509226 RepID=A0A410TEM3_9VIRU|nr:putative capsid protein [Magnaporthe oryzae partitivirus 3]
MADSISQITSTVTPSESASAAGSKKSKPGKAERAARRAATGSQAGSSASPSKAAMFASSVAAPKPQPGKFPIVFQTGAGEPSRDEVIGINPDVLARTVDAFPGRFNQNMRYAEFLSYSEYDDEDFGKQLKSAALLRLSQQLVHAHVNVGLPQGDFAPVASTEVHVPSSVSAFISQYGEFTVPALGTRYLYSDYPSVVRSIVWAAKNVLRETNAEWAIERSWLPVKQADGHTKQVLASRLNDFLKRSEIQYDPGLLEKAMLSGTPPDNRGDIKPLFGGTEQLQDRFDFLFRSYVDSPSFVTAFTATAASAVLSQLNLEWKEPSAGHVDWTFNVKELFTELSDDCARKSKTYAQFFEMSSSQTNRTAASGSQSQFAVVSTRDSVTVVKTRLALSAPEFSLVACFPASAELSLKTDRNVVLTTPLSVTQRATEFVQLDWR